MNAKNIVLISTCAVAMMLPGCAPSENFWGTYSSETSKYQLVLDNDNNKAILRWGKYPNEKTKWSGEPNIARHDSRTCDFEITNTEFDRPKTRKIRIEKTGNRYEIFLFERHDKGTRERSLGNDFTRKD